MGWTDGLDDSDSLLPFLGVGGFIVFIVICLFTYCHHGQIMRDGEWMEVVEIGTCRDGKCVIKVRSLTANLEDPTLSEKETGSEVFVGTKVKCGFNTCYKD